MHVLQDTLNEIVEGRALKSGKKESPRVAVSNPQPSKYIEDREHERVAELATELLNLLSTLKVRSDNYNQTMEDLEDLNAKLQGQGRGSPVADRRASPGSGPSTLKQPLKVSTPPAKDPYRVFREIVKRIQQA